MDGVFYGGDVDIDFCFFVGVEFVDDDLMWVDFDVVLVVDQ